MRRARSVVRERGVLAWKYLTKQMFSAAMDGNIRNLAASVSALPESGSPLKILDLGCWDGETLQRYAVPGAHLSGVEMNAEAAVLARQRSVRVVRADLNRPLPFRDQVFDVVTSNQVIEHLHDTDAFLRESYRVLHPGGMIVVSTENLGSWHNILALVLGWQAFSLTNVSQMHPAIGNPLANLRGGEPYDKGWEHLRVFSSLGLQELLRCHGFSQVRVSGAGYYPLPAIVGRCDPRHAAFITAAAHRL